MTLALTTRLNEKVVQNRPESSQLTMPSAKPVEMSAIYPKIVQEIRGRILSGAELGRLTGVSERQVHRWGTGDSKPLGLSRSRLLEVNYVIQSLRDIYTEDGAAVWLHGPNRNLSGQKPIEMLENGQFNEVLLEIERLNVGAE